MHCLAYLSMTWSWSGWQCMLNYWRVCAQPHDLSADLQSGIAAALQIEMVFLHSDRPTTTRQ